MYHHIWLYVQDERSAFVGRHERSEARQSMEIDNHDHVYKLQSNICQLRV